MVVCLKKQLKFYLYDLYIVSCYELIIFVEHHFLPVCTNSKLHRF